MQRRLGFALVVIVVFAVGTLMAMWPAPINDSGSLPADQDYPPGAGPNAINFTTLDSTETNLTHTPRAHWDSYVLGFTETPDTPPVEGTYNINSTTGEIIADRFHGATVYRSGSVYAFVQPAEGLTNDHQRKQFADDDAYVYDNATEAYYRYDQQYGHLAPTTIGRHHAIVESYIWEAVNTTTHHGVPVITYRLTGRQPAADRAQPAESGTLWLGADDGVIYAYDLTLETGDNTSRYSYRVRPAPFPDHEWVQTATRLQLATDSSS